MACLGRYIGNYRNGVSVKTDKILLLNAKGLTDDGKGYWYIHTRPELRLYMRLVRQEIHRRGLKVPTLGT